MTFTSALRTVLAVALLSTVALAMPSATAETTTTRTDPVAANTVAAIAEQPYMGWSSWSLQATDYPGTNPDGPGSWLNEANVLAQADAMAEKLKPYGYEHINVDAGWQDGVDEYGRPVVNKKRFPNGIQPVADYVHERGLKFGLYAVVGLGFDAYNDGNTPIYGTDNCFTRDIVYPDLRTSTRSSTSWQGGTSTS